MDHVNHVRQLLGIFFVVLLHQRIASDSILLIVQNSAPAGNLGAAEVSKDDSNESVVVVVLKDAW